MPTVSRDRENPVETALDPASDPACDPAGGPDDVLAIRDTPLIETLLSSPVALSPGFAADLDRRIHQDDEMFHYLVEIHGGDWDRALAAYFDSGRQAFAMTEQIVDWRFAGFDDIHMLDFASGYGRVTRHLLSRIPAPRLTVSDVMPEAVRFQRRTFGLRGLVSTVDPDALELPRAYDVVQCVSLFSHLPEKLFRRWLRTLWSHVAPGGLLILSVHDVSLLGDAGRGRDYLFSPSSENRDLDPEAYGSTWVSSGFVESVLADEIAGYTSVRLPRGLCAYQDVYVVVREANLDVTAFSYDAGAGGHLDVVDTEDGGRALRISGWAASVNADESLDGVDFLLNGEVIASVDDFSPRPDVARDLGDARLERSGFDLAVPLPEHVSFSHDVAMVVARKRWSSSILAMGCVYSLLADAARANLRFLKGS